MIPQILILCILAVKILLAIVSILGLISKKEKVGAVVAFFLVDVLILALLYIGDFFDPLLIKY